MSVVADAAKGGKESLTSRNLWSLVVLSNFQSCQHVKPVYKNLIGLHLEVWETWQFLNPLNVPIDSTRRKRLI